MRTRKQSETSRLNGARFQGPATPAGIQRSSRSACKHGLLSGSIVAPGELERRGCGVEDLFARRCTPGFRDAMREAVAKARGLFIEGLPLARLVDRRLALDIGLFSRGGMRVPDKVAARDYDAQSTRPVVSKTGRAGLLLAALARLAWRGAAR